MNSIQSGIQNKDYIANLVLLTWPDLGVGLMQDT